MKKFKFIIIYIISLLIGNGVIYIIDLIGKSQGKAPWGIKSYLIFNVVIIIMGIVVGTLSENKEER